MSGLNESIFTLLLHTHLHLFRISSMYSNYSISWEPGKNSHVACGCMWCDQCPIITWPGGSGSIHGEKKSGREGVGGGLGVWWSLWYFPSSSNRDRPRWFCVFSKLNSTERGGASAGGKEARQPGRGHQIHPVSHADGVYTVETWPVD